MRRQEIARVVRVGSTPRGTEKEQREHLPPLQEQLFKAPRQGDAGMGGATEGGEVAGKAALSCFSLSPVHLLQSLQTLSNRFLIPSGFMVKTGGVLFVVVVVVFLFFFQTLLCLT